MFFMCLKYVGLKLIRIFLADFIARVFNSGCKRAKTPVDTEDFKEMFSNLLKINPY